MNISKGDKKRITIRRPRNPQAERETAVDGRDTFQTPNYAVDLLVPFLDKVRGDREDFVVWECAAGLGKIVRRLEHKEFTVVATDLQYSPSVNFLRYDPPFHFDCIVTNVPFSIKRRFYQRCVELDKPFALLMPADYSQWVIDAVRKGAEKIVPTRRIDYITPNVLNRIREGEVWEKVKNDEFFNLFETLDQCRETASWETALKKYGKDYDYKSIYDVPQKLLRKYSSSYFHSLWLTKKFGLGKTETFVELTNAQKDNI